MSSTCRPTNFSELSLRAASAFSALFSGKLWASNLPTDAPEGAHALPMNLLSVTTSTSMVLLPLLLKTILPRSEVIEGINDEPSDADVIYYLFNIVRFLFYFRLNLRHAPPESLVVGNYLVDGLNARYEHPSAAVALDAERVHDFCRVFACLDPVLVLAVLVCNQVAAGKTAHRYEHIFCSCQCVQ